MLKGLLDRDEGVRLELTVRVRHPPLHLTHPRVAIQQPVAPGAGLDLVSVQGMGCRPHQLIVGKPAEFLLRDGIHARAVDGLQITKPTHGGSPVVPSAYPPWGRTGTSIGGESIRSGCRRWWSTSRKGLPDPGAELADQGVLFHLSPQGKEGNQVGGSQLGKCSAA